MRHFLHRMGNEEASRCSRAKKRQGNVQKRVKHVQSCYLLIRPIVSFLFVCFLPFTLPWPLSTELYFLLNKL